MITKRIIPCLDVKDGRVVKGVNFENLGDVASPVDMAKIYTDSGADEKILSGMNFYNMPRTVIIIFNCYLIAHNWRQFIFTEFSAGMALNRIGPGPDVVKTANALDNYTFRASFTVYHYFTSFVEI